MLFFFFSLDRISPCQSLRSFIKVFKGRFDAKVVVNADMYREKLNYIHNNPCSPKWQLAERPEDYLHSSASNYIKGYGIYDVELIY